MSAKSEAMSEPVAVRYGYREGSHIVWAEHPFWGGRQPDITQPLYSQSPAEARALAIAECARVCEEIGKDIVCPEECAAAIRDLSAAPSVSEQWVEQRVREVLFNPIDPFKHVSPFAFAAVRATLAALGVTVEGAAK